MTSVGETGGSGRVRRIHRGIIHQEDSLSSSRWFTTDEAGRMLHVTDALLSLGTLQVASRSVRTRKSRGPRFKREHALFLSLSLSLSNRGIWRTRRGGEQAKGVCKSQWKRIFPPPFSRDSVLRANCFTFFRRLLFRRGISKRYSWGRRKMSINSVLIA